jgi:hypothetical protein
LHSKKAYFDAIDQNNHLSCSSSSAAAPSLASRILVRSPAVYSISLDGNIIPTIEFLARVWGTKAPPVRWQNQDMDDNGNDNDYKKSSVAPMIRNNDGSLDSQSSEESLVSLLGEYPSILTLSLEGNIQPTINFYNRTGYMQLDEDWNLERRPLGKTTMSKGKVSVVRGRYIAASLFNRLLPRWHYCQSVASESVGDDADGGDSDDDNDNDTAPVIPLHILVSSTDRVFCDQMSIDHVDYIAYKTESIPRLKFSSQFDTWLKTGRPIDV